MASNVGMPAQGMDTNNNDHTARSFFLQTHKLYEISGVCSDLIYCISVFLIILNSGHINSFVDLYPWFYKSVSLHKMLMHGSQIMSVRACVCVSVCYLVITLVNAKVLF